VPLNSLTRCYGALVVESKDQTAYAETDVKVVQRLTDTASLALEVFNLNDVLHNFVAIDEATGVATRKSFLERLQEETVRSEDFNHEIAIVMLSVDRMDEQIAKYGKEAFEFVLQNIGRMIRSSVRPYDVIGRYKFNTLSVLLVNTTPNEASLWAEKIRKNIAGNILNIENKSFSVTVSIGVAGASGGNIVRVF
jgi:diguanylate cyclase (GGDEF)-like protein